MRRLSVYRNTHKGCWSVKEGRLPVRHAAELALEDGRLVVRPGGRARVLREKRKCVHAFAVGRPAPAAAATRRRLREARYSPYRAGHFTLAGGEPVREFRFALLARDGRLYVET